MQVVNVKILTHFYGFSQLEPVQLLQKMQLLHRAFAKFASVIVRYLQKFAQNANNQTPQLQKMQITQR